MEAQAISSICNATDMLSPMWQPLLERDIRKVPPLQTRPGRRRLTLKGASSAPSSAEDPPTSVFSAASVAQSSATSPTESRRSASPASPATTKKTGLEANHPPPRRKQVRGRLHQPRHNIQRYWNEFDDGDEVHEDDVYAIYVNPDEDSSFPGAETVSKAFSALYQSLGRTKRRIISWLPLHSRELDSDHDREEEGVRRPLLGRRRTEADRDNEDSSDTDTSDSPSRIFTKHRSRIFPVAVNPRRTSLASRRPNTKRSHVHVSRETALFRTYLGCYVTAFILLIMSTIMTATGRHKAQVQVDAGVIVGVIAALGSGLVGISLMISREERLSWLHRSLGAAAFLVVCIGSGCLLAVVGGTL